MIVRRSDDADLARIFTLVNQAAQAYRGVIPPPALADETTLIRSFITAPSVRLLAAALEIGPGGAAVFSHRTLRLTGPDLVAGWGLRDGGKSLTL